MSFDREVLRPIPGGWHVPDGEVLVRNGETVLGSARLEVVDEGIMARITLLGGENDWDESVRVGVTATIVKFHYSPEQPDVQVVDEVRVRALEVG